MYRVFSIAMTMLFVLPLWGGQAEAKLRSPSKYRKIKKGIGNCVFSTKGLGFKKEASYKLKKSFKEPEEVHARCYFAKQLKEYASKTYGKIDNSLMGMAPRTGAGPAKKYFTGRLQFAEPMRQYNVTFLIDSNNINWDQVRLDMPLTGRGKQDCEFTMVKFKKPNKCANIANEVRYMKKKTSKVCLYIEFDKVDKKVFKRGKGWVKKRQFHVLAKGCFDYTVK